MEFFKKILLRVENIKHKVIEIKIFQKIIHAYNNLCAIRICMPNNETKLHCPRFLRQGDPKKIWRKKNGGFYYSEFTFLLRQPGVKKENPEIY